MFASPKTMRIRMLTSMVQQVATKTGAPHLVSYYPGNVIDWPAAEALRMIERGYAADATIEPAKAK